MKKPADISLIASGSKGVSHDAAETLAIGALTFLACEPERLERFLSLGGISPENLRATAASPGFLAAVLHHVAQDEALLMAFASHNDCDPRLVIQARDCLDPPARESP